jgi:hypothetical protein
VIQNGLAYTLVTPDGTLTFNPTGFSGNGLFLLDVEYDHQPVAAAYPRAGADGAFIGDTKLGGIASTWTVLALADTFANRQTLEDQLLQYVGSMLDADGTVKWTPQDSSAGRQNSQVRAVDVPRRVGRDGVHRLFEVALVSARHFAESQTETETDSVALTAAGGGLSFPFTFPLTFTASGGGTLTVPNAGNTTSYPVLRVYGPISAPVITLAGTSSRLVYTSSVATGDYLEYDLFARTVKLNGTTNVRANLNVAASTWFGIAAGGAGIALSGSGYDGSTVLTAYSRSAWRI